MGHRSSILLIGGDAEPTLSIQARLTDRGYRTLRVGTVSEGATLLRRDTAELVVIAPPLPEGDPGWVLARVRQADGAIPIVVAGDAAHVRAEELMFQGAFDCVADPQAHPEQLLKAVGYALGTREEDRELRYLRGKEGAGVQLDVLVGESEPMRRVFDFVRRVCARTAHGGTPTILLTGETGTGKGALAKAIHRESVRRHRPFVEINCAAIPANLVEAELFGHERGAFTDAGAGRAGLFETADSGTLFLDEVPSLPLELQAKLLTAIEEKRIRRLGGREMRTVDVQLIAAGQPILKHLVRDARFREDLYHRLNVLSVKLPPLRERDDDRLLLAEGFVAELCAKYGVPPLELDDSARQFIERYHWPGNVRELRNQIERIILLSETDRIEGWQFERSSGQFLRVEPDDDVGFRVSLPPSGLVLEDLERTVIEKALERHEGNVSQTARYLSMTRQTLIYRMKKHGLGSQ